MLRCHDCSTSYQTVVHRIRLYGVYVDDKCNFEQLSVYGSVAQRRWSWTLCYQCMGLETLVRGPCDTECLAIHARHSWASVKNWFETWAWVTPCSSYVVLCEWSFLVCDTILLLLCNVNYRYNFQAYKCTFLWYNREGPFYWCFRAACLRPVQVESHTQLW